MNSLETDVQAREPALQLAHVGFQEAISAEEQHAWRFCSILQLGGDRPEGVGKLRFILTLRYGHNPDGGFSRGPGRDDSLLDLCWVPQNECSCRKGNLIDGPEGAAEIDRPVHSGLAIEAAAELAPEMAHQMDI